MSIEKKTSPGVGDAGVKLEVAQRLERSAAAQAAFRELERDAPTGEGPIVRKVKALLAPEPAREPGESDRREHVARAPIHTNPLPEAPPEEKIVRRPRPELEAITLPDLRKKDALAPMAVPTGGRAIAGTLRIAVPPPADALVSPTPALDESMRASSAGEPDESVAGAPAQQRDRRLTVLVALALLALVCALVLWLISAVRDQERETLARESAEAARVAHTPPATAVVTSPLVGAASAAGPIESTEPSARLPATGAAVASASARSPGERSARASAAVSATPSAKSSSSTPPSVPAASSSSPWIE